MRKFIVFLLFLLLSPIGGVFANENVIINEAAWMGMLPKGGESSQAAANNEWIELLNLGQGLVSLEGWKIMAQDGMPDISLSGVIPAGGYFLLERGSDDVLPQVNADLVYPFKNNALSNSGERLFIKNANGETIDEINFSSGWSAGDNDSKQTAQKVGSTWITATSTPRAQNYGAVSSPVNTPQNSMAVSGSSAAPLPPLPTIRAYAGEDRVAVAGAVLDFAGQAYGAEGQVLEGIRFWWNFGDGGTLEGRVISHIFQIPGQYLVGLHVSSGVQAASDYLAVSVIPNQIGVKGVVLGEGGFVRIFNPTDYNLDIGEWVLEDSEARKFIIPSKTKIGAKTEVAFPNVVTGLLRASGKEEIAIHYPNLVIAIRWPADTGHAREIPAMAVEKQATGWVSEKLSEAPILSGSLPTTSEEVAGVIATRAPNLFLFIAAAFSILAAVGFLVGKKLFPWKSKK